MGRDLRIIDPDSIYHVISTGSNRGPIAWDEHDFESLLRDFSAAATHYSWEVFAWCAMNTHHHVVVRTPADGFSPGFQALNGNHARRTNRRHGREAHLFKNRPFVTRVDSDAYLVTAILYVVRNPVEAGICTRASQWRTAATRQRLG
jgi:putative transposase